MNLTRRRVLGASVALASTGAAHGEQPIRYDSDGLKANISGSIDVLQTAIKIGSETASGRFYIDDKSIILYVEKDFYSRRSLVSSSREVWLNNKDAITEAIKGIPDISDPDFPKAYFDSDTIETQLRVVDIIVNAGLPIIPPVQSILPKPAEPEPRSLM